MEKSNKTLDERLNEYMKNAEDYMEEAEHYTNKAYELEEKGDRLSSYKLAAHCYDASKNMVLWALYEQNKAHFEQYKAIIELLREGKTK